MAHSFISRIVPPLLFGLFIFSNTTTASAALFDAGIPADWTCTGNCGTSGADGVVTQAPGNSGDYGWISTAGSNSTLPTLPGLEGNGTTTNGSILQSSVFSANAGDTLAFYFNYVTSDGGSFADYAWARLLDTAFNQVALLFIARTHPVDTQLNIPTPEATLSVDKIQTIPGAPDWSPLGYSSQGCYMGDTNGCGYTGWILSTYEIANAGNYILEFGVANWNDTGMDSGLAISSVTLDNAPITVPEPTIPALLGLSLAALGFIQRRKNI